MKVADPKYTPEQRAAAAEAYVDRGVRPARRVAELAAAGELIPGQRFEISPDYVLKLAAALRRRRAGEASSALARQPPRDAVEAIRRRLAAAIDHELTLIETLQRRRGRDDRDVLERLRQIARLSREFAALPGPTDPRPVPPGQRHIDPATGESRNNGGPIRGGLAGAMLRDIRQAAATDPDPDPPH